MLLRLVEEDGLTQADLSRRQRVEAPSMCRLVDRLERDGLVERRADPDDRRATRVHISAEGLRVAARGAAVVEGLERSAFAGLDRDERRLLNELLGRVLDGLRPGRRAILSGRPRGWRTGPRPRCGSPWRGS